MEVSKKEAAGIEGASLGIEAMPAAGAAAEGGSAAAGGDWGSVMNMDLLLAIFAYIVKRNSLKSQ